MKATGTVAFRKEEVVTTTRWTTLMLVFVLFAGIGFFVATPQPAEGGGCILSADSSPFGNYCVDNPGSSCYECWYADNQNDGFEYCVENADGSVKNCQFFEDIQSAP